MAQRLINNEIDKRVNVKVSRTIKKVSDGVHGIMYFGADNDYPVVMEKLINGSVTAKPCANAYAKHLIGGGFANKDINKVVIGKDQKGRNISLYKLLRQVARSIAYHQGAYIHVNLTMDGRVQNAHLKPFKDCRFASTDDKKYSAKILVYDNWAKDPDVGKYDKKNIGVYNVFNANGNAVAEQIRHAGGIEKFKGQIYTLFLDDAYFYPLSTFDECYLDCDTEAHLSLFKNRLCRNGFFKKTVMRIQESLDDERKRELADKAREALGVDGDGFFIIEDQMDENGGFSENSGFRIDQLDSAIDDDKFSTWPVELANNIRKAAKGMPAVLIDYEQNKLGVTSGESLKFAVSYYNAVTAPDRDDISEAFAEIFTNSTNEVLRNNTDWQITPLILI